MKTPRLIILAVICMGLNFGCSGQVSKEDKVEAISELNPVEVYYFHYTRRCVTCNAVENVSKQAVTEYYKDKVDFASYNLDEEAGKAKGNELGVAGQTLLIVSGNTKINITNEGFMNARSNPEKLKAIIKEKIDPLL